MVRQTQTNTKVTCDSVLGLEVFLELVIVFDDFVPSTLELVNEGAGALALMSLALGMRQEVCTVLTRPK